MPGPNQQRYATQFIFHVARFIQERGRRGVDIAAFYAVGASDDGRRISRRLGFEEISTSPSGDRSGFILRADNPTSQLAQYYQAGVATRTVTLDA